MKRRRFLQASMAGLGAVAAWPNLRVMAAVSPHRAGIVVAVNAFRAKRGLEELTPEPLVGKAAELLADAMAARGEMDHGAAGDGVGARLDRLGYDYRLAAENIAAGYASPDRVVAIWARSDGHRRNMEMAELRHIGVGYAHAPSQRYRHFWALVMAAPLRH